LEEAVEATVVHSAVAEALGTAVDSAAVWRAAAE